MNTKKPIAFKLSLSACLIGLSCSAAAQEIEEIIVRSSLIDSTVDEISNPLHIISGESIANDGSQSLGSSLDDLVGLSTSDYGAAVGQPIIRGMSGSRVKILNNGIVVRDVSGLGPDHINEVDMNDIQQIEVIRGPSSLLYSNGTIGGIVNIVDNTIAREDILQSEFKLGLEAQSVNDGDSHNLSYRNNIGGLNLSFSYKDSQFENFEIPDGAVLHAEEDHEEHEDEHDEDHHEDDHDEHEDEAHEEDLGYLANSDTASTSTRLGLSKAGDWGFFGISYSDTESVYGIPFHGEGHGGHDEHEGDDHEDEEHEDEAHEGEESHEGERIFARTESKVFNLEGSYKLGGSLLKKVDYFFRDSDYSLIEQHAEMEEEHEGEHEGEEGHDDEHHAEGPTEFKNDSQEYGAIFDLGNDSLSQKLVVNFVEEDISVIGEEAFINPTENEEITLGYYISKEFDLFHLDFGVRHDQISRSGSIRHDEDHDGDHEDEHDEDHHDEDHAEEEHGDEHDEDMEYFNKDINNTSFALSLGKDINDAFDISLGLARVERAPTAVELLMNGPHLATGREEVGNINLASEQSNNIDLTLNYENDGFYATLAFFQNDVDNYIYLLDETEEDHDEHGDEEHGGLILANYVQRNAEFDGYELEIGKIFTLARGSLAMSFAQDSISAKFSDGSYVPRITPKRNLIKVAYTEDDLKLALSFKDAKRQNDIADNETVTDGFQVLNINLSKTIELGGRHNLTLSVFGKNLLDEVARNHSSFVKNEVPMAGRNLGIRANYSF